MAAIVFSLAALCIGLGLSLMMRAYWVSRYPKKAWSYRRQYQQLLARIEQTVTKVNSLANLLPHIKNAKVMDDFESCLRMLETLLSALHRTPNFGFDSRLIYQVQPLVKRVETKIEVTYRKFKSTIEDRPLFSGLLARWQEETAIPAQGCYFCSRPFVRAYFKPASIKVDGILLRIYGCHICVSELKNLKKVKVLYFHDSGRPVHWSLVESYKPMEQYWDLNRRQPSYQTPRIELLE